uniref:Nuclear pore complex protein n=1 Tax=Ananas comosus var. bracteatus TaxID=296719 RepID=A0A6V7NEE7_ANACO|nr:unnamed protein product [Ananas comosus var. bracteatus]
MRLKKIAEQDGGKYEMAVYALQCSNLKRLMPVCTDWESACWAMAKSWLDVQVDLDLTRFQQSRLEEKQYADDMNGASNQAISPSIGPENWPYHVLDQQPRDIRSLLQKLHSSENVHEAVSRSCREQHRQIEMNLMVGDIANLLDLLWSWVSPSEDDHNISRSICDPQLIRFGAHVVLVLRYLLDDEMKDAFNEKLVNVGDLILHMYAIFLFSKQQEELVGIYASQLSRHRCIDLFVEMMEHRLNSREKLEKTEKELHTKDLSAVAQGRAENLRARGVPGCADVCRIHVKYKLFLSAIEYLPFSSEDKSKASFEDIIESRVLSRSRQTNPAKHDKDLSDVAEQHRLQSLQKAMVIQWLCFTPPSTIPDFEIISAKLLIRALIHSNTLFREFALISMWRVPKLPIGAHKVLGFLAEPLKQPKDTLLSFEDLEVSENLEEFEDWREYYSCDATYRNWLEIELKNASVSPIGLSSEEKDRAIAVAGETLSSSLSLLLSISDFVLLLKYVMSFGMKGLFGLTEVLKKGFRSEQLNLFTLPRTHYCFDQLVIVNSETVAKPLSHEVGLGEDVGEERPWLNAALNSLYDDTEHIYLELHATAMLCLPSGECVVPDATLCTALTSALYSSVSEEDVLKRQLLVSQSYYSSTNNYYIEVALRCVAVSGDGLGFHEANDGGILATVMAAGFKAGELNRFQAGVTMEISRLDAWYSDEDGSVGSPATYIVRGLCRRCCLPEIILRCMQVSISLAEAGDRLDHHDQLIELVASSESGMLQLFSQHQLQEFLLFERECVLSKMELEEEHPEADG